MDQTESDRLERINSDDEGIDAVGYTAGASNESALLTNEEASAAIGAIPDEPDQIKAQIEETRNSMGSTIDAIQEKLSFSNIAEQVKETVSDQINSAVDTAQTAVYDATVGKAGGLLQLIGSSLSDLTGNLGNSLGGLTGNLGTTLGELTGNMGKSGKRLVQKTGGNTLPLLLIGLGAGLLLVQRSGGKSRKRSSRDFDYDRYREMDDSNERGGSGKRRRRSMIGSATETVGGAISSTTGAVGSAANTAYQGVTGAAGSAYEGVTGAAGSAYQGVAGAAGSAYEGVSGFAGTAYERAGDFGGKVQSQYQEQLESNPLVVGAVAAAIGAVVGFSIPNTEYENQWMGETRDQLVTQAQGTARQTLTGAYEQARTMVTETVGEAAKTVQEQTKS